MPWPGINITGTVISVLLAVFF